MKQQTEIKRTALKLDPEGMQYVREIFAREWIIHNPTPLTISGLGEIVATSMVLQRRACGQLESYFSYTQGESKGEIVRCGEEYYLQTLTR